MDYLALRVFVTEYYVIVHRHNQAPCLETRYIFVRFNFVCSFISITYLKAEDITGWL